MTPDALYPYFILVGATILAVVAWLLRQARNQAARTRELILLNEQLHFDLPDLLRDSWPTLAAGGFLGMHWALDWFGTRLEKLDGHVTPYLVEQSFEAQSINLTVKLYMAKNRWERRYFSQNLAQSFFLLLRMDMWIKLGSVHATFEQSARMTVFLQHDIKNMLQLLNLTAEQLQIQTPDREKKLLPLMERSIPALRDRANLILAKITDGGTRSQSRAIDLRVFLQEALTVHELHGLIEGNACVEIADDALHSIIDNLLGNYHQLALSTQNQPSLHIHIRQQDGMAVCEMTDQNGAPCAWPERLFEPFWSEHSRGRGVGLYQAREISRSWGGSLALTAPADAPLAFTLSLPLSGRPETIPLF